ncbi:hypothetical protein EYF80_026995 [Liparis tanakae]|uniref:Uncharacterized protein n=1 Tax=Liparis tanakae TaxID=230148 RepID=A0A4Z2HAC7_9TELE|nr:hypothetical protein EYF80_026995 [Liparis tanakae]
MEIWMRKRMALSTELESSECDVTAGSLAVEACAGSENLSGQIWHWYGLSPVWMFLWIFRFQNWENCLPQMLQPKGFSPV